MLMTMIKRQHEDQEYGRLDGRVSDMMPGIIPRINWEQDLLNRCTEKNRRDLSDCFGGMVILSRRTEDNGKFKSIVLETDTGNLDFCCPECRQKLHLHHAKSRKQVQDLPILGYQVKLDVTLYEYECRNHTEIAVDSRQKQSSRKSCRTFLTDAGGFLIPRRNVTRRGMEMGAMLGTIMSCSNASKLLNLMGIDASEDMVGRWRTKYIEQYGVPESLQKLNERKTRIDRRFLKNMESLLREDIPGILMCKGEKERHAMMEKIICNAWMESAASAKNHKKPVSLYMRSQYEKRNSVWK